ncbi:MAG TPA: ribosomal protein S18-alanine N-acetyltransferase [Burkholderiales bacterium]|nr:ribosomal protein S18-alanine N-acetyltransferase [Burkholderiales bacterium]
MSAQLEQAPLLRPMQATDIDAVMRIERGIYAHPWTRGNFRDSLNAGYSCWIFRYAQSIVGYAVMMIAGDEAHLLNLSIAAEWQRQGWGRKLLQLMLELARQHHARVLLLEVRPSNAVALALYRAFGFRRIALRRGYYPAGPMREDAIVLELSL